GRRRQRLELSAPPRGWTVLGLDPGGRAPAALQLAREAAPAEGAEAAGSRLEPTAIPPFVAVTRTLALGLDWQVSTQVSRIAPVEGAIVVAVPLPPRQAGATP